MTVLDQKQLGTTLWGIADQLRGASQKLDALKVHKKGFMQQLFPNVEEVNHE